jgi:hypothetical protein
MLPRDHFVSRLFFFKTRDVNKEVGSVSGGNKTSVVVVGIYSGSRIGDTMVFSLGDGTLGRLVRIDI